MRCPSPWLLLLRVRTLMEMVSNSNQPQASATTTINTHSTSTSNNRKIANSFRSWPPWSRPCRKRSWFRVRRYRNSARKISSWEAQPTPWTSMPSWTIQSWGRLFLTSWLNRLFLVSDFWLLINLIKINYQGRHIHTCLFHRWDPSERAHR